MTDADAAGAVSDSADGAEEVADVVADEVERFRVFDLIFDAVGWGDFADAGAFFAGDGGRGGGGDFGGDGERGFGAVAEDDDGERGGGLLCGVLDDGLGPCFGAVDGDDLVAGFHAGLFGWAVRVELGDAAGGGWADAEPAYGGATGETLPP